MNFQLHSFYFFRFGVWSLIIRKYDGSGKKVVEDGLAPRPTASLTTRREPGAELAMAAPQVKMGVDPARSRDIVDDMINVVRPASAKLVSRTPRARRALVVFAL